MKRPASNHWQMIRAFTLIEVVLALAIVSIGLVTVIGLFPQGLTSARNASDDSLIAMIVQGTIAERRIDVQTGASPIADPNILPRWFTADGKETNHTSAAVSAAAAMFKCEINATAVPGIPNLESTHVRVVWPWYNSSTTTKTPIPPNTNTFVTEITRY